MKPFNRKDWFQLMNRIKHLDIVTLEKSYNLNGINNIDVDDAHDDMVFGGKSQKRIVNIRHDVDDDIQASIDMGSLESELGIKSTFFILNTSSYFNENTPGGTPGKSAVITAFGLLHHILGHEIGWHNNAISDHLRTGKPLKDCINDPLSILRSFAPVIGTASHGDPLCHQHRYINYYIFQESQPHPEFPNLSIGNRFKMEDFGLKYEAYHTGHTHYISDSGGVWHQNNEDVIRDFENYGGKLQILIHPQWWDL